MEQSKPKSELRAQVELGLQKSYEKLVAFKKMHNSPLIVSENGKVVAIPPDEIPPTREVKG